MLRTDARAATSYWRTVFLGAVFYFAVDTRLRPEDPLRVGVLVPMCEKHYMGSRFGRGMLPLLPADFALGQEDAKLRGMGEFFGTKQVQVALTSTSVPNTGGLLTFEFSNTDDIAKLAIDGRIYGGMHYRTSGVHGSVIARKVAHDVARHHFRPVE